MEGMVMMTNANFWRDKKIFLTGHTGFKGGWLSIWLRELGANIYGYSRPPSTQPSLFEACNLGKVIEGQFADIGDIAGLKRAIAVFQPDIIIHAAAQPLVRYSYKEPVETYQTNVMGTVSLLESARNVSSVRAIVNVTTDKCYKNLEWVYPYREDDELGGHDPYSSSKACSELITESYRKSFFEEAKVGLATVRAGNVIGGGDWAKDRLVPDVVKSIQKGQAVTVRNPNALRPWQHVLEPLYGYMTLTEKLYGDPGAFSEPWNFGPQISDIKPVSFVVEQIGKRWRDYSWHVDTDISGEHEASILKLDASKSFARLGWKPVWCIERAIDETTEWYSRFADGQDAYDLCVEQIGTYTDSHSKAELNDES